MWMDPRQPVFTEQPKVDYFHLITVSKFCEVADKLVEANGSDEWNSTLNCQSFAKAYFALPVLVFCIPPKNAFIALQ